MSTLHWAIARSAATALYPACYPYIQDEIALRPAVARHDKLDIQGRRNLFLLRRHFPFPLSGYVETAKSDDVW
jgi:hypothetical protein